MGRGNSSSPFTGLIGIAKGLVLKDPNVPNQTQAFMKERPEPSAAPEQTGGNSASQLGKVEAKPKSILAGASNDGTDASAIKRKSLLGE